MGNSDLKRVAIMQPYFFPYIGYFQLISDVDKFFLLDEVQFIRHGWIERNRLPKPNGEAFYIRVPLQKHHQKDKIKVIQVKNNTPWKDQLYNQIRSTYGTKTAHNRQRIEQLLDIFHQHHESITRLNEHILKSICLILGISTKIEVITSNMYNSDLIKGPGDWALEICKYMNGTVTYVNPIAGANLFDLDRFKSNSIQIEFLQNTSNSHDTQFSIIHLLMTFTDEQIATMLDDYIITKNDS